MNKVKKVKTVSECCGAETEERQEPISIYGSKEITFYCSKCHKPCEVKEDEDA